MTITERVTDLLADRTASIWLKQATAELMRRDPVDALNDAEYLRILMASRLAEMQGGNQTHASEMLDLLTEILTRTPWTGVDKKTNHKTYTIDGEMMVKISDTIAKAEGKGAAQP